MSEESLSLKREAALQQTLAALEAARGFEPEDVPGFIGPKLAWWQRGFAGLTRAEALREFPTDPYEDTTPYVDLDTADTHVAALQEYQREVQQAEARRIQGLLLAHRSVLRQAGELGQSRSENGIVMRAFILEAALAFQVAESTATTWLYTAQSLEERCPRTWERFQAGQVAWRGMTIVDQQAAGLDAVHLPAYDEFAADLVGRIPMPQLKERLHGERERLQADTAAARHRAAFSRRGMHLEALPDGMGAVTIIAAAPEAVAIHDGLRAGAVAAHGLEGETRGIGQLMADIAVDLLIEGVKRPAEHQSGDADSLSHSNPGAGADGVVPGKLRVPGRKGVTPQVSVLVPALTLLGHSVVPATLAGYGPIDLDTARRLCGAAPSFARILTHPVTGVRLAVDASTYSPPADLRRYLAVRDGTCRAPGCTRPVAACDVDHVQPWGKVKRTEHDNLAFLCRRHHQVKGSTWWDVDMRTDGVQTWRSAWGTSHTTHPADQPEPTPLPDRFAPPPERVQAPTEWYTGPPDDD